MKAPDGMHYDKSSDSFVLNTASAPAAPEVEKDEWVENWKPVCDGDGHELIANRNSVRRFISRIEQLTRDNAEMLAHCFVCERARDTANARAEAAEKERDLAKADALIESHNAEVASDRLREMEDDYYYVKNRHATLCQGGKILHDRAVAAEARAEAAMTALREYGDHDENCPMQGYSAPLFYKPPYPPKCSCGYDAALATDQGGTVGEPCKSCGGTGTVEVRNFLLSDPPQPSRKEKCPTCNGTGEPT